MLLQKPKIVSIDTKTINIKNQFIHNKSVLEFVLSAGWKDQEATTPMTENSMETLIVGRTGCGQTTFIQKLGKNKMFGEEILEIFWVSKINLSEEREESIRASFKDQNV